MSKSLSPKLAAALILISLVVSACSAIGGPTPTEIQIEIGPPQTAEAVTPMPTQTLRPTPTETPVPTETLPPTLEPSPTDTLDPYHTLIQTGLEYLYNEEFDPAIAEFTEAIRLDPANPLGYLHRGRAYNASEKPDEAIVDFNYALNYDPSYVEAYNARGVAWAAKSQFTQAIKDFTKAIELKPDMAPAYTNRATTYMSQKEYDLGLQDFSKAIELTPDDAEAYFNRGQAYLTVAHSTQDVSYADYCIADFNQAIALLPDVTDFYLNRALCYLSKPDLENGYVDLTKAIALDSNNARAYLFRAAMYPDYAGITMEQALEDARKVLELSTDTDLKNTAQQMLDEIPKITPEPYPSPTP